jgi:hypothetical protein
VHEQDMGRQTTDNIHGTPWQQAAVAIITPLRAEAVEPRRPLNLHLGEALLAGETGGCPVGYTPWLMISGATRSRCLPQRNT